MKSKAKKFLKIVVIIIVLLPILFVAFLLYSSQDEANATFDNVETKLNELYDEKRMGGFAVSVFNPESVIYSGSFGYADIESKTPFTQNTQIYIASIAKTTIGLALMKAEELGLLKLDDPINDHLPFAVFNPSFSDDKITIRHLATHTSSLDYNEAVVESLYVNDSEKEPSLKGFMADYFQNGIYSTIKFTNHRPGSNWNYSNIGAGLAAYIIEYKSAMTFSDFTEKYIFDPIKLNNTNWFESNLDSIHRSKYYEPRDGIIHEVENKGVKLYPCRDMITDIKDLTTYCQAIMSKHPAIMKEAAYEQLLAPSLSSSVTNQEEDNHGVFFTIDRNNYGIMYQLTGHSGGDYCINTMMYFDPKTNLGYIFIGNTGHSELNRFHHIRIYRTLVSLGDHYLMTGSFASELDLFYYKWHNYYNRIRAFF